MIDSALGEREHLKCCCCPCRTHRLGRANVSVSIFGQAPRPCKLCNRKRCWGRELVRNGATEWWLALGTQYIRVYYIYMMYMCAFPRPQTRAWK